MCCTTESSRNKCYRTKQQRSWRFFHTTSIYLQFLFGITHRWGKVFGVNEVSCTLKSLSLTRWSCRHDATKALWENYSPIMESMREISESENEKRDTRQEASRIIFEIGNHGNDISFRILEHYFRNNTKKQCLSPEELNDLHTGTELL